LAAHLGGYIREGGPMLEATLPMLDAFMPTPELIMVRFRRWNDILKSPAPDQRLTVTTALWHFARAMAYASTGKIDDAEKERTMLASAAKSFTEDRMYGFNPTTTVLSIPENVLSARIALAKN